MVKKILTDEQFEQEWNFFLNNLNLAGVAQNFTTETLRELMRKTPAAISTDTGAAYDGGLLCHINLMTKLAQRIAKMVSGSLPIDKASLLKVCCLHQISKTVLFEPNDNEWEMEKRGLLYKMTDIEGRFRTGERSALIANNAGVKFTDIEWEAMRAIDTQNDEAVKRLADNPLTIVIRQANELANKIERVKAVK